MSKKIMLINATDTEEIRVAILNDGVLSDFDIEFIHNEKIKGNIYKARVSRVDASLQAAFVHYGGQKNGFLPIGELPKSLVSPDGRRGRIQDLLQRDQEIMVQAVREELGTKGAMVTAQVSLPGRYLVLTPGNSINGISRKIESAEEREHFRKLVDALDVPQDMGVIVRTASLGVTQEDFERDLESLLDTYKEIQTLYNKRVSVGLVWQEDDVVTRTLRDTWTPDISEIHIDDSDTFKSAQSFFKRTMPQHLGVLHHYNGKKPLFSKFRTEEQIDSIYARCVPLPSGGKIVLDQTEALVAIDVNSGKTTGDNQEDTALRTNLEAAEAIASQLRLRDMAGLIAIDFIDMKRETNNKVVMERLVEHLRIDKARMEVGKINRFGVLIMTRQRIRPSIMHVTHEPCPVCQGTGQVKNIEALVLSVLRRLKSILSRNSVQQLNIRISPTIATNLLNQRRSELAEMENAYGAAIFVSSDHEITYGEISMEIVRKEEDADNQKRHEAKEINDRKRDAENETVVLESDAPISFDKALPKTEENAQNGRRASQRASLDERERLRALFEAAKPEVPVAASEKTHQKQGKSKAGSEKQKREIPAPPTFSPEIIASLAVPAATPRKALTTPTVQSEAQGQPTDEDRLLKEKPKSRSRKTKATEKLLADKHEIKPAKPATEKTTASKAALKVAKTDSVGKAKAGAAAKPAENKTITEAKSATSQKKITSKKVSESKEPRQNTPKKQAPTASTTKKAR